LSVSASASFHERKSGAVLYLDIVLVVIAAVPALALGAPVLGFTVGAVAWILGRVVSVEVERRLASVGDLRRRLGLGVTSAMLRVWLLAVTIMVTGVTATRADGLTAALVIFGAFSIYLARSAFAHMAESRESAR
jgi:hypothetical protein